MTSLLFSLFSQLCLINSVWMNFNELTDSNESENGISIETVTQISEDKYLNRKKLDPSRNTNDFRIDLTPVSINVFIKQPSGNLDAIKEDVVKLNNKIIDVTLHNVTFRSKQRSEKREGQELEFNTRTAEKQIEEPTNGFFTVFLENLFKYISLMPDEHAKQLLKQVKPAIENLFRDIKELENYIPQPLVRGVREIPYSVIQRPVNESKNIFGLSAKIIRQRHTDVSKRLNVILNFVDRLFKTDDKNRILKHLDEFKYYPKFTQNPYHLVQDTIIDSVLVPFFNLKSKYRRFLGQSLNNYVAHNYYPGDNESLPANYRRYMSDFDYADFENNNENQNHNKDISDIWQEYPQNHEDKQSSLYNNNNQKTYKLLVNRITDQNNRQKKTKETYLTANKLVDTTQKTLSHKILNKFQNLKKFVKEHKNEILALQKKKQNLEQQKKEDKTELPGNYIQSEDINLEYPSSPKFDYRVQDNTIKNTIFLKDYALFTERSTIKQEKKKKRILYIISEEITDFENNDVIKSYHKKKYQLKQGIPSMVKNQHDEDIFNKHARTKTYQYQDNNVRKDTNNDNVLNQYGEHYLIAANKKTTSPVEAVFENGDFLTKSNPGFPIKDTVKKISLPYKNANIPTAQWHYPNEFKGKISDDPHTTTLLSNNKIDHLFDADGVLNNVNAITNFHPYESFPTTIKPLLPFYPDIQMLKEPNKKPQTDFDVMFKKLVPDKDQNLKQNKNNHKLAKNSFFKELHDLKKKNPNYFNKYVSHKYKSHKKHHKRKKKKSEVQKYEDFAKSIMKTKHKKPKYKRVNQNPGNINFNRFNRGKDDFDVYKNIPFISNEILREPIGISDIDRNIQVPQRSQDIGIADVGRNIPLEPFNMGFSEIGDDIPQKPLLPISNFESPLYDEESYFRRVNTIPKEEKMYKSIENGDETNNDTNSKEKQLNILAVHKNNTLIQFLKDAFYRVVEKNDSSESNSEPDESNAIEIATW